MCFRLGEWGSWWLAWFWSKFLNEKPWRFQFVDVGHLRMICQLVGLLSFLSRTVLLICCMKCDICIGRLTEVELGGFENLGLALLRDHRILVVCMQSFENTSGLSISPGLVVYIVYIGRHPRHFMLVSWCVVIAFTAAVLRHTDRCIVGSAVRWHRRTHRMSNFETGCWSIDGCVIGEREGITDGPMSNQSQVQGRTVRYIG